MNGRDVTSDDLVTQMKPQQSSGLEMGIAVINRGLAYVFLAITSVVKVSKRSQNLTRHFFMQQPHRFKTHGFVLPR